LPVTASLGVASFPHQLVAKPADFITLADAALYDAKRSGRNRVVAAL
jgi:PleD family two-component response regulator